MTNFHIPSIPLPSFTATDAKQERKHLLEEVRKRRCQSEQERKKRQQQAYQTSEEYREYQERLKQEAKLYR